MTAPAPSVTLLPCPFCNGVAESDSQRGYRNMTTGRLEDAAAIYCTSCNADMTWCYRDTPEIDHEQVMQMLVEQWNTRATLSQPADARERIARIIDPGPFTALDRKAVPVFPEEKTWMQAALAKADAIIAAGLVADEAAIRADERKRCAKVALDFDRGRQVYNFNGDLIDSNNGRHIAAAIRRGE